MYKSLLIFSLLLLSYSCFSQNDSKASEINYDYSVGPEFSEQEGENFYFDFGDEFIVVRRTKKTIIIDKFNTSTLEQILSNEYVISEIFPKNWVFEGMEKGSDKVYFFYSSWSGKEIMKERLYLKNIDFESASFDSKEDENIITVEGRIRTNLLPSLRRSFKWNSYSFNGINKFMISKNIGTNNFYINYIRNSKVSDNSKNKDVLGLIVMDPALKILWQSDFRMPYTERRMEILDMTLSSQNAIVCVIKKYFDDSNKESVNGKLNYDIEILRLLETGEIEKQEIEVPAFYITDIDLHISSNGTMSCAGFYSYGGRNSQTDGWFTFDVLEAGILASVNVFEMPLEMINKYARASKVRENERKEKRQKNTNLSLLEFRNVHFDTDGSITIIGEQIIKKETSRSVHTWFSDVYVINVNRKGEFGWMHKIPKRQKAADNRFELGIKHFYRDGFHYITYIDNIKNLTLPEDEEPAQHLTGHGGFLYMVKIDHKTSKVYKNTVFDVREPKGDYEFENFSLLNIFYPEKGDLLFEFKVRKRENAFVSIGL